MQSFEKSEYSTHCNLVFKLDAGCVCVLSIQNNKTFFRLFNQFRLLGQSMANHSIISGFFQVPTIIHDRGEGLTQRLAPLYFPTANLDSSAYSQITKNPRILCTVI